MLPGNLLELCHGLKIPGQPVAVAVRLSHHLVAESCAFGWWFVRVMLAGEHPASEWIVHAHPYPLIETQRQHFVLDTPGYQVVRWLRTGIPCQIEQLTHPERFAELPDKIVGTTDVAHLPLVYQVIQSAQCLINRRGMVPPVGVVDINVISTQSTQTAFHAIHDVLS
ncbi:hypothetical protein ES703_102173 [subsurface metagenome]